MRQQGVQAADDSRGGSRGQGQAYVEFAGFQSRTDAYDVLHLDSGPAAEISGDTQKVRLQVIHITHFHTGAPSGWRSSNA